MALLQKRIVPILPYVDVVEAPYVLAGEKALILPLAARATGEERGYYLYLSVDGSTYRHITRADFFQPFGFLKQDYTDDTYSMDDSTNGMIVDLICDGDRIESITRAEMLTGFNLAMVGGEIISFQNIIPMGGTIYNLRNIFRARFDTEKLYHYAGERFWFLDKYGYSLLDNEEFVMGARRFFKFVSYTQHGAGRLDKARVVLKDIFGRSKTPLMPINLEANGHGAITRYQTDIVLTWNPRIRGEGAGVGIAYSPEGSQYEVTDASPTFEGCFKVKVTVGGSIVRTVTDIAALTCTYTQAMNISDNGGLASSILFEVSNYLTYKGNIFESPATSLAVTKMV